jgi:hypothetical protein
MNGKGFVRQKTIYINDEYRDIELVPYTNAQDEGTKKKPRRGKVRETLPKQKALNSRRAVREFRRLAQANFGKGDYSLDLTYAAAFLPDTYERAIRDLQNLIECLRRLYKKLGIPFRYMAVISDTTTEGELTRLHIHLLITGGVSRDEIESKWKKGWANCDRLKPDFEGISAKAGYLSGQGIAPREGAEKRTRKKWTCSQNLIRPWESKNDGRYSLRQLHEFVKAPPPAAYWQKQYPGFEVIDLELSGEGDIGGEDADLLPRCIYIRLRRTT